MTVAIGPAVAKDDEQRKLRDRIALENAVQAAHHICSIEAYADTFAQVRNVLRLDALRCLEAAIKNLEE